MKVIGSAAKTVFYLKKIQGQYPSWRLLYKIKCKSTENELTNLLGYSEIKKNKPVAIIAREQFSGVGQNSKTWVSPKGGIWLSAAYPIFSKEFADLFFSSVTWVLYTWVLKRPLSIADWFRMTESSWLKPV